MSRNGKTRFRPRWRTLLLLLLIGIVLWSAYSYWSEYSEQAARKARELMAPAVGSKCTIELSENESVTGIFAQLNDEWVVLSEVTNDSPAETWIPREKVQRMRVEP